MPSPQEVLAAVIPHPADSTEQSRTAVAKHVMAGLELNGYYFMRRRLPMDPRHTGECETCGCDMVYTEQTDPTFLQASERLAFMTAALANRENTLKDVAKFLQEIVSGRLNDLSAIIAIAKQGLGQVDDGSAVKLPPPMETEAPRSIVPPGTVMVTDVPG